MQCHKISMTNQGFLRAMPNCHAPFTGWRGRRSGRRCTPCCRSLPASGAGSGLRLWLVLPGSQDLGAADVVGIDLSAKMLARAAELTRDEAIRYRQGDLDGIALSDEPFDLTYSSLALQYLPEVAPLLCGDPPCAGGWRQPGVLGGAPHLHLPAAARLAGGCRGTPLLARQRLSGGGQAGQQLAGGGGGQVSPAPWAPTSMPLSPPGSKSAAWRSGGRRRRRLRPTRPWRRRRSAHAVAGVGPQTPGLTQ